MSYIGQANIGLERYSIGATLYGVCSSLRTSASKIVTMSDFDQFISGVSIYVRFIRGNSVTSGVTLQVGSKPALNVIGTCTCKANEILGFTYEADVTAPNNTGGYWRVHTVGDIVTNEDLDNALEDFSQVIRYRGELNSLPDAASSYSTYKYGDVIRVGTKEYLYDRGNSSANSTWIEFGDESQYITINPDGGLQNTVDGLGIKTRGIETNMIDNGAVTNAKIDTPYITIAGNQVSLGGTLSLNDMGLSTALRFIGIATNNSLADESTKDPFDVHTPPGNYRGETGDVVIDPDSQYEYVWTGTEWERLGGDSSYKIKQTPVAADDVTMHQPTNTFVDSISQDADGVITVTKAVVTLDAGIKEVYTDLTNPDKTVNINTNDRQIGIGIDGILGVANGGTGTDLTTWPVNSLIYVTQQNSAKLFSYIESPAAAQILTSSANGPVWTPAAWLTSVVNTTPNVDYFTTLELGNEYSLTSQSNGHSEGRIILHSAGTNEHIIRGSSSTENDYTHILPNSTGYIVQTPSNTAVGSDDRPVFINAVGLATAITYPTANRLYYTVSTTSFVPTNHFSDETHLGVNLNETSWPQGNNNLLSDVFYVNGNSTLAGTVKILSNAVPAPTTPILQVTGSTTISGDLDVTGDISGDGLTLNDSATFLDSVGIGGTPDNNHILHIIGQTLITGNTSDIAHLDIDTNTSNQEILVFYTEHGGIIGNATYPWTSAEFSTNLIVGSVISGAGQGIEMDGTGYLHVVNGAASICLDTIASNTAIGEVTITAIEPKIKLTSVVTAPTVSETWSISNTSNNLYITNIDHSTTITGSASGWNISPHVGINANPETISSSVVNPNVLVINGSTLITNEGSQTAQLQVRTESSNAALDFFPSNNKYGYIGRTTARWERLYLARILDMEDVRSSIVLTIDDSGATNSPSIGSATIELNSEVTGILLNTLTQTQNWSLLNTNGIFTLTNNETTNALTQEVSLQGNAFGFELTSKLYINNSVDNSSNLDLYVDGDSELQGIVGIGAPPILGYSLYVDNDSAYHGHVIPYLETNEVPAYDLGIISTNPWRSLYLCDTLDITQQRDNIDNSIQLTVIDGPTHGTAKMTMYTHSPSIVMDTPNGDTWTIANITEIDSLTNEDRCRLTFMNSQKEILIANNYGIRIFDRLYINYNSTITDANDDYTLYVNGTSFITDDVNFMPVTDSNPSPKLIWSGGGESASIYYHSTGNDGYLVINTATDQASLIAFAKNDVETMYIDTGTNATTGIGPAIYPATTNTCTLGIPADQGEQYARRWNALYIGTADTYGDPYLPVYWNDGVPTSTFGVTQYMPFTFTSGQATTTLINAAYNQLYGIQTYVLQIVVTSGANYLSDEITWSSGQVSGSTELGYIQLATGVAVTGTVVGYIITARGTELTNYVPPTPPSE